MIADNMCLSPPESLNLMDYFLMIPRCVIYSHLKGGGFYDKLGADVGTRNPKKSGLATFIDISG